MSNLPASSFRDEGGAAAGYLSSLFTVAALALADVENWSPDVRKRLINEVKAVLELGAVLAEDVNVWVERNIDAAAKQEGA